MPAKSTCEECGTELPANAPQGLCPRCLAGMGLNLAAAAQKPTINLGSTELVVPVTEEPGDRIGRYKLLQKIGEGGMGVVYMAEQVEPLQRKVALKIIKAGMDTREVIARFEAERQAIALMDHPNIARALDAGATEAGRPYFVMELVRGIPITDYCDQDNLPTRERLQLFMKVCQAVQHAHQKGVIHRDIKPSNVLVTQHDGEPVPKVIDFGVAKALGQKLTEKTLFTGFHHMIGTPAYMSPEQAALSGLDIDTRADIYSLGVLLYELLTGVTPFDSETFRKAAMDEIRRMIRETEPLKPSTRLQTLGEKLTDVAKHRGTLPASLSRLVRGDLDWIVMRCLEKDRKRRYETANGLAADVARHLNSEPVVARSPSAIYRFQKLVRRNRLAFAAAGGVVMALIIGTLVSTLQAMRATRAERAQTHLRELAEAARAEESAQREKASAAARQSLSRLVRLNEANAARLMEDGDYLGALPWFAEGFKLGANQSRDETITRARLATLLSECPRPVQLWFHGDHVNSATFSPDGRLALTASRDNTARVWDVETGKAVGSPVVHAGAVMHACFSSDGALAVSVGTNGAIVWRPDPGQIVHRLEHPGAFYATFSPSGQLVATAGDDRAVRVWDSASGEEVSAIRHNASLSHIAFSHDSRLLATGTYKGTGQLWDVAERKQLHDLRVGDSFRFLAFSPDDKLLAGADWANAAFLWEVGSGTRLSPPLRHHGMVAHVAFSLSGNWLATSSLDGTVKLWDLQSRTLIQSLSHRDFPMETRFNTDDSALLTRTFEGWVYLWDLRTGKPATSPVRHSSWVTAAELHPDGRRILTACADGSVRVWDLHPNGALFWPWQGQAQRVLAANGSGQFVITESSQFQVQTWDTGDWSSNRIFVQATGPVSAAFLDEDGERLLMMERSDDRADLEQRVRLWNRKTSAILSEFEIPAPTNRLVAGVFAAAPDCSRVALGRNREVEIWNVATGTRLNELKDHSTTVSMLRFSPDGTRLLVNCGRQVHVLDSASGRDLYPPLTNTLATSAAEFSPDGTLIATAGSDVSYDAGEARVWDAATGRLLQRIFHPDGVPTVAFSSDSHWLAAGCENRTARVWDVRTGAPVTPTLRHSAAVIGLAFSPDRRLLASVTQVGAVWVWETLTGEVVTPPLGIGSSRVRFLAGSRYLLTEGQSSQFWRLEPIGLPAEDLLSLAQLFANHRVDLTGALEPLPPQEQATLYRTLSARYPECFRLNAALHSLPTHSVASPVPRAADTTANQIDLTSYFNARLDVNWQGGAIGDDLANLRPGLQRLDGVPFDVRGVVQLGNRTGLAERQLSYPHRIDGIKLQLKCHRVHFLQASGWQDSEGSDVGRYVIHYSNGHQHVLRLVYGEDLRDWWSNAAAVRPVRHAALAWESVNSAGNHVALFHRVWENPLPDVEIRSIDFISTMAVCAPFLVAITVEP